MKQTIERLEKAMKFISDGYELVDDWSEGMIITGIRLNKTIDTASLYVLRPQPDFADFDLRNETELKDLNDLLDKINQIRKTVTKYKYKERWV